MSLAAEASVPAEVLADVRAPFAASGGAWTDAPVLQPLTELLDLAGEAMRARLVIVQGDGGDAAALRPDFTIPVAQAHIASRAAHGRYLYEGKAFRAAPAGSSRPIEFLQIGVELFGPSHDPALDDASVAALAWTAARAGGRDDLAMWLGDLGLFSAFLSALGIPEAVAVRLARVAYSERALNLELSRAQEAGPAAPAGGGRLAALLTDLPEVEAAAVLEELWRLAGIQPVGGRSPAEIVHRLALRSEAARAPRLTGAEVDLIRRFLSLSAPPRAALDSVERLAYEAKVEFDVQLQPWVRRLGALVDAGVPETALTLSPGFARAFGYYDGVLFEVRSAALGGDRPVAAGGRYDSLLPRLGAQGAAGAVGCMVRPARAWSGAPA